MNVVPPLGSRTDTSAIKFQWNDDLSGTMMGYDVSRSPFGFLSVSLFLSFSVVLLCVYFTAAFVFGFSTTLIITLTVCTLYNSGSLKF